MIPVILYGLGREGITKCWTRIATVKRGYFGSWGKLGPKLMIDLSVKICTNSQ